MRLRSEKKGQPAYWKEYKTGRLQGIYYGAFFQDNISLTDWVNSQNIGKTLYCLGDGHDGIWNLFEKIAVIRWLSRKYLLIAMYYIRR